MRTVEVRDISQVAEARRAAVAEAHLQRFSEENAGRVAIVATELTTNIIKHGGGGQLLVGDYDDPSGRGVECIALDKGSGMSDVAASKRDGHSTSGSSGTGLGAIFRGSDATDIFSRPGLGTAILARFNAEHSELKSDKPRFGVINIAVAGENVSGDAWCRKDDDNGFSVMVADGLGHGPLAAEASQMAIRLFMQSKMHSPADMLEEMHAALKPTRGAAAAVAQVNVKSREIIYSGVGNIAASLINQTIVQRMVSNNGTLGHIARRFKNFSYTTENPSLLVVSSDGLATSWRLGDYPGLSQQHPTLIASVLYRDFCRGRDDVTVLVCKIDI